MADVPDVWDVVVMDVQLHVHLVTGAEAAQDAADVGAAVAVAIAVVGAEAARGALDHAVVVVLELVKVPVPEVVLGFVQDLNVIPGLHGLQLDQLNDIMALLGLMSVF